MKSKTSYNAISGRIQRLVRHWKLGSILAFIITMFCLFAWAMTSAMGSSKEVVSEWIASIEDPTEKGCAYIALAICAHAIVMAFKTFSHDKITIKTDKPNAEFSHPRGED